MRTLGAHRVDVGEQDITVHYWTAPGSRHLLALFGTKGEPLFLPVLEDVDTNIDRTVRNWTEWMGAFTGTGPGPTPCGAARSCSNC